MTAATSHAASSRGFVVQAVVDATEPLRFARDLGGSLTHVLVAATGRALAGFDRATPAGALRRVGRIGHVSPEALEGGPIGRVVEGDVIEVIVDPIGLTASVDLVGHGDERWAPADAARVLSERPLNPEIAPDPGLPADTALWARMQSVSGGLWGGCVYDHDAILAALTDADQP
jgi:hypothetical protein